MRWRKSKRVLLLLISPTWSASLLIVIARNPVAFDSSWTWPIVPERTFKMCFPAIKWNRLGSARTLQKGVSYGCNYWPGSRRERQQNTLQHVVKPVIYFDFLNLDQTLLKFPISYVKTKKVQKTSWSSLSSQPWKYFWRVLSEIVGDHPNSDK